MVRALGHIQCERSREAIDGGGCGLKRGELLRAWKRQRLRGARTRHAGGVSSAKDGTLSRTQSLDQHLACLRNRLRLLRSPRVAPGAALRRL